MPSETQPVKYGFYDRLIEVFPSQIVIDATEVCNLACIHCPHESFKRTKHYTGAHLAPVLNKKMTDEVREKGRGYTEYIRYTGNGEPLLHPNIFELLSYAKKHSGVFVTLTSNAALLGETKALRLIDTGIDMIDISIDAFTDETYAKIRVGGKLSVTRTNVSHLINMKNARNIPLRVVISFIEQPLNLHETDDFETFWKAQGADFVVVRRLHSASGCINTIADSLRISQGQITRRPCLYPWERIMLSATGMLAFCATDWEHGSVIADYRNTTIHEVWHSQTYKNLRYAHIQNDYRNFTVCDKCPDWALTRWPSEDKSYADLVADLKSMSNNKQVTQ